MVVLGTLRPCPVPPTRRPLSTARPDRRSPVARWSLRRHRGQDRRARLRWLPPRALARPDRRRRGAPADDRRQERLARSLVARWPDARLPVGPADRGRGGARPGRHQAARGLVQVYLLPVDGGEARRLTDLPRGVTGLEWSPDGTRLVVVSTSHAATFKADRKRPRPRQVVRARLAAAVRLPVRRPARLHAQRRGLHVRPGRAPVAGGRHDRRGHAADRRPDRGARAGLVAGWHADRVLGESASRPRPGLPLGPVHRRRRDARRHGRSPPARCRSSTAPTWMPDGRSLAALGHRFPSHAGSRNDIWLFAADGSDANAGWRPKPVGRARPDARRPA